MPPTPLGEPTRTSTAVGPYDLSFFVAHYAAIALLAFLAFVFGRRFQAKDIRLLLDQPLQLQVYSLL